VGKVNSFISNEIIDGWVTMVYCRKERSGLRGRKSNLYKDIHVRLVENALLKEHELIIFSLMICCPKEYGNGEIE